MPQEFTLPGRQALNIMVIVGSWVGPSSRGAAGRAWAQQLGGPWSRPRPPAELRRSQGRGMSVTSLWTSVSGGQMVC